MLGVSLICVGKLKERFYADAVAEYAKRLSAYCRLQIVELPEQRLCENPSDKVLAAALDREAEEIERHIPGGAVVIAMCVEGKCLSSPELAAQISAWANGGVSQLCFLVGGSYGLSQRIKDRADLRLSVSKMTFPHHLFRVMLAEQIYRAFTIREGGRYHK